MNNPALILIGTAVIYALGTFAYFAARKASYHKGKAEVYREFAETFSGMGEWSFVRDKERKKREQQRHWMRLVMCDPAMADALRDALKDGDEYWKRKPAEGADNCEDKGAVGLP